MSGFHAPMTKGDENLSRPTIITGTFTTNGGSDPIVFGGSVIAVRRLENGAAAPFFRVQLKREYIIDPATTSFGPNASFTHGFRVASPTTVHVNGILGEETANPATTKGNDEFDYVVKVADVPVDTAGIRIDFQIMLEG